MPGIGKIPRHSPLYIIRRGSPTYFPTYTHIHYMIPDKSYTMEDLLCDESFQRAFLQHAEADQLDWDDWMSDDPARQELVLHATQMLRTLSLQYPDQYIAQQAEVLQHRLKNEPVQRWSIRQHGFLWRAAAAIAVLVVAVWWWYKPGSERSGTQQAIVHAIPAAISVCKLPDGTIARLKTGSSLRLAEGFGQAERRVILVGEAYFEVAKDAQRPFRVIAGDVTTTAIGTAFNVRAYPDEAEVKIVLIEGKVKVERPALPSAPVSKSVELAPGQQVRIGTTEFSKVEAANIIPIERWKAGYVLTFRATPFPEVVQVLNANYKTHIIGFEGTRLTESKITGEFDRSMSLTEIMESLAFVNGFKYRNSNDTIRIIIDR
jgi:transmembrane sensor